MKGYIKYLLFILCVFASMDSFAQTKAEKERKALEGKRIKANSKIAEIQGIINDIKGNTKKSQLDLLLLAKKTTTREHMIKLYSQEVGILDREIVGLKEEKNLKEADLKVLKEEYAKMLYYAYKNRSSYDKLSFIFSSDDFSAAYKRLKYIQSYTLYRQEQAKLIRKAKADIDTQVVVLQDKMKEKQFLILNKQEERDILALEKMEKEELYQDLKSEEKKMKANLRKKKKERDNLDRAIDDLIKKIIAEKNKKTKPIEGTSVAIPLTPKEQELAKNFASNKGKLPWPSSSGIIGVQFSNKKHEVHTELTIINNGIDIITRKGETARAVFSGKVEGVLILPGNKYSVLISHGNYFTVYSNLEKPYVADGDEVNTKDPLGMIKSDSVKGTVLHFQIWENADVVNPEYWILKN